MEKTAFINKVFRSLILLTFAWTQSFSAYYALEGKRFLYSFMILLAIYKFTSKLNIYIILNAIKYNKDLL